MQVLIHAPYLFSFSEANFLNIYCTFGLTDASGEKLFSGISHNGTQRDQNSEMLQLNLWTWGAELHFAVCHEIWALVHSADRKSAIAALVKVKLHEAHEVNTSTAPRVQTNAVVLGGKKITFLTLIPLLSVHNRTNCSDFHSEIWTSKNICEHVTSVKSRLEGCTRWFLCSSMPSQEIVPWLYDSI